MGPGFRAQAEDRVHEGNEALGVPQFGVPV